MKVYVVAIDDYEPYPPLGVFDSFEAAEDAIKKSIAPYNDLYTPNKPYSYFYIKEMEMNKLYRDDS